MAVYRYVQVGFWKDVKVNEEMTPEDKLFYLYLLTNPYTTQIGIYQITKKQISFDMGYSMETVQTLLERFENHHKLIKYNTDTKELVVLNWGKYNFNRAGKPVEDCIKKEVKGVKDASLFQHIVPKIENERIKRIFLPFMPVRNTEERVEPIHPSTPVEMMQKPPVHSIHERNEPEHDEPPFEPYDDQSHLVHSEMIQSDQINEQNSASNPNSLKSRDYADFYDTSTSRSTVRGEKEKEKEKEKKDKDQPNGRSNVYPEEFESFWSLYPRKVGKMRTFGLWEQRVKKDASQKELLKAVKHYAEYCQEKGLDAEYIKHPSTFLSSKRDYEDWLTPPVKQEKILEEPKNYADIRMEQDMAFFKQLNQEDFVWSA